MSSPGNSNEKNNLSLIIINSIMEDSERNNNIQGRRKNNDSGSGDKFSFPIFPLVEEEDVEDDDRVGSGYGFEFGGCATDHSGSPIDSPADHLFFNGRLLPHEFRSQVPPARTINTFSSFSRSTSVTSSKDYSFVSSRSNSSNSRSSSCSSARTSISTTEPASSIANSERKLFVTHHHHPKVLSRPTSRRSVKTSSSSSPHYGSSRRWQFIITPPAPIPPALILKKKKKQQQEGKGGSRARKARKTWFWRRFFRSFVSACKECHAINPSPTKYPPN